MATVQASHSEGDELMDSERTQPDIDEATQIVEVDPALSDGILLTNRLPGHREGFWNRARSIFSAAILTPPELEALREGGDAATASLPTTPSPVGPKLLLPEIAEVAPDEVAEKPKVEEEEAHQEVLHNQDKSVVRLGEDRLFALFMHDEWMQFLEEELLLLRIERLNEILEKEQTKPKDKVGVDGSSRADGVQESPLSKLPKSPWSQAAKQKIQTGQQLGSGTDATSPKPATTVTLPRRSLIKHNSLATGMAKYSDTRDANVSSLSVLLEDKSGRSTGANAASESSLQPGPPIGSEASHQGTASAPVPSNQPPEPPGKSTSGLLRSRWSRGHVGIVIPEDDAAQTHDKAALGELPVASVVVPPAKEHHQQLKQLEEEGAGVDPTAAGMPVTALEQLADEKRRTKRSLSEKLTQPAASEVKKPNPAVAPLGEVLQAWTPWRSPSSPVEKSKHTRQGSVGGGPPLPQLSPPPPGAIPKAALANDQLQPGRIQDSGSGVRAAMAAAEAAATGGKRIRRVWERMRKIVFAAGGSKKDEHGKLPGGSALSMALRHGEIFKEQRGAAWLAIACSDTEDDVVSRSRYQHLLKQPSKFTKEIERDVNRTFPTHQLFREDRGPGQQALFNVIKAYSVFDKEVGYTQGMGFVVATLLMYMGDEDAFCCLVFLMYRCGLRTVFLPDMEQLQLRLYQMTQLVLDCLPRLHAHFEELELKPVMYAADWFLTLFSRSLPHYLAHRVFDIVFAERTTAIIFKLAIVLLQVCRRQLLQCPEVEYCMNFLRQELPAQLNEVEFSEMEELVAKAMRVELPFESMLRLEAEYELLAEEAATAANEVAAAALASEAAAATWESSRQELEKRLLHALQAQKQAEEQVKALQKRIAELEGVAAGNPHLYVAPVVMPDGSMLLPAVTNDIQTGGPSPTRLPEASLEGSSREDHGSSPLDSHDGIALDQLSVNQESEAETAIGHEIERSDPLMVGSSRGRLQNPPVSSEEFKAPPRPDGKGLRKWKSSIRGGEGGPSAAALLQTVMALRQEKAAIGDALASAEMALTESVRRENQHLGTSEPLKSDSAGIAFAGGR